MIARQHPRAMTELCGFNPEHQQDIISVSVSPSVTSTETLCPSCLCGYVPQLYCHTDLQLHWNICWHSSPMSPSPPSAGYRWSSQALTWATTNLFMVCYRRVGVLIQTAETTLTLSPQWRIMEGVEECQRMRRTLDTWIHSSNIIVCKYQCVVVIQFLDKSLIYSTIPIQFCSA